MKNKLLYHLIVYGVSVFVSTLGAQIIEIPADVLRDKIRGGLLGQMIGNLNGIPHEMDYIEQPGNIKEYIPSLPEGARTDDDTDFEWVYFYVCLLYTSPSPRD